MLEKIKEMGLSIDDSLIENFVTVSGEIGKLRKLREMLDDEGYIDDTPAIDILSAMVGMKLRAATENKIGHIMIYMFEEPGYMALAD